MAESEHIFEYSSRNSPDLSRTIDISAVSLTNSTLWNLLPDQIKSDPAMELFRKYYDSQFDKTRCHKNELQTMEIRRISSNQYECDEEYQKKDNLWFRYTILSVLLFIWTFSTIALIANGERNVNEIEQILIQPDQVRNINVKKWPTMRRIQMKVSGALLPKYYGKISDNVLRIWFHLIRLDSQTNVKNESNTNIVFTKDISDTWFIPIVPNTSDDVPTITLNHIFTIEDVALNCLDASVLQMRFSTNLRSGFSVSISYDLNPVDPKIGIMYAGVILLGLYVAIVFEIVHRTIAATLAAIVSIAILAILQERPTNAELASFVDVETLLLLFSMMILVGIFSETGIFDYLAVLAYQLTNGKVWPLINTLCVFSALVSSFLDNVTTALLMTPITIRLCEVSNLNPIPILTAMLIYSNLGGGFTLVGDPPNAVIGMNSAVVKSGVTFGVFTLHMGVGLLLIMFTVHLHLRFIFRNLDVLRFDEPQDVQELRHEIAIWQKAVNSLSSYEGHVRETLVEKCQKLGLELRRKLICGSVATEDYRTTLEDLKEKYPIKDKGMLIKSGVVLCFVLVFFFLHSIPDLSLSLGWTSFLGVLLLLIFSERNDLEVIFSRVEWSTLLFFTALFILMGTFSQLGLIEWIGQKIESIVVSMDDKDSRLAVAILLILWVSAIASSFVDNIPLSTMMIRVITSLASKDKLGLPLQPMVWALAFGGCLGGVGTLIAASCNLVCAGVAEQHGYKFSFTDYFKTCYPIMLGSVTVATVYLLCAHVILKWNY